LRRRLDGTARGALLAVQKFLVLISIFQAIALTMCVNEASRGLFATMRIGAI
jgi:hypothetical protein